MGVAGGHEQRIQDWIEKADLQLTNIHGKLTRLGVVVPYRTLHRFAAERCGFGRRRPTVRVADGEPGVECQIDFARMGLIADPGRAASGGARVDLHRGLLPAHVRVADLPPDPGCGDRWLRGCMGLLRRFMWVSEYHDRRPGEGHDGGVPRRGAPMRQTSAYLRDPGSDDRVRVGLGDPLVDDYLEFVAARCRPNTVLATAYDLKVFFSVVGKDSQVNNVCFGVFDL